MTIYTPDVWEVLEVHSPEYGVTEKVLAGWYGWYGGLRGSDSWKLNSGITKYEVVGDWIEFHGYTGSVYRCHKSQRKFSSYTQSIYSNFVNQLSEVPDCSINISPKDFT